MLDQRAHPIRPQSGNGKLIMPPRPWEVSRGGGKTRIRPHPDELEGIRADFEEWAKESRRLEVLERLSDAK